MSYCDAADVRRRWANVSDSDIDDSYIAPYITRSEAEVDLYLNSRYDVPFDDADVPEVIKAFTADIAAFYLIRDKDPSMFGDEGKKVEINYNIAINTLSRIQEGELNLTGVSLIASSIGSTTEGYHSIFDLDDEKNWGIDADQDEDIVDARNEH
ncbi:MAG: phage protein Gp36 family protein [Candidatus Aenigmatarchaeota archaeon]